MIPVSLYITIYDPGMGANLLHSNGVGLLPFCHEMISFLLCLFFFL